MLGQKADRDEGEEEAEQAENREPSLTPQGEKAKTKHLQGEEGQNRIVTGEERLLLALLALRILLIHQYAPPSIF